MTGSARPAFPTRVSPADGDALREAARILRAGGLVGMPTETVYGLAGLATSDIAVAEIYAVKGRPTFNPLIAHFADAADAAREANLDATARRLAERFWPGPLTLVAPVAAGCRISLLARAGLDTLALRVPGLDLARALIAAVGAPLAAPSANRSGRVSPTLAEHVRADLDGRLALVLDGGPCAWGVESTVVACLGDGPRLLRPGAVSREEIEAALGARLADAVPGASPAAPGALASHYAPRAPLALDVTEPAPGAAALDFAAQFAAAPGRRLDLSPRGDLE
jgi:L-threonylcarbamoyladenylate synthase